MPSPIEPITLSPQEIQRLRAKLATLRHNVNNYASLIVATAELIQRRPDQAARLAESLSQSPEKIAQEIQQFSLDFDCAFRIMPN